MFSSLANYTSNVSSVRTWCRRLTLLFFTEPVPLNLLACLLIVLGLGTGRPGNFTRNLRRVSEHDFLLFIYVLWIYTRSHNENSCLGMSQIAIITITPLTALYLTIITISKCSCFCFANVRRCSWSFTRKLNWNKRVSVWEQHQYADPLVGQPRLRVTAVCSRS